KSSLAFQARQLLEDTTLVNFTGFRKDGAEGLIKIASYYKSWFQFISNMKSHESILVCDRFFFSEMVYSQLYKNYKFDAEYRFLCNLLSDYEVDIVFLTINDTLELVKRLERDKVPFANVAESVEETIKQQEVYDNLLSQFSIVNSSKPNIRVSKIDTTGKNQKEVSEEFFKLIEKGGQNTK
ncbi:hypothetical protein, partial [Pseudobutyrivibrio sp.]